MGTHIINIGDKLFKKRIKDGRVISEEAFKQEEHLGGHEVGAGAAVNLDDVKKAYKDGEGC